MEARTSAPHVAFVTDLAGTVRSVLRREGGEPLARLVPGARFPDMVEEGSRAKASRFLDRVRRGTSAALWELHVAGLHGPGLWWFSGVLDGTDVLITAAASPFETGPLLRRLLQEGAHPASGRLLWTVDEQLGQSTQEWEATLEHLTQLNNELANAQREQARLNAELRRLSEERSRLMAIAAHDLRNPLGVILGFSELLLEETAGQLDEEHTAMLRTIEQSSRVMRDIVMDSLDVNTLSDGKVNLRLQEVDLSVLLASKVAPFRYMAARKGTTVELRVAGPGLRVNADASKLDQVFTNLVTNAIAFSPPGAVVRLNAYAREGMAVVEVADNGPGIPPEELSKLFKPYGRTSVKSTAGEHSTGLGLAITKGLVEAHGGTVEVVSVPGWGSTFRVCLPSSPPQNTALWAH